MGNLKKRIERLEEDRKVRGFMVIIADPGETGEEALQKHLAEHLEDNDEPKNIFGRATAGQDPPSGPPPRPQPPDPPKLEAKSRRPLQITR